MTFKPTLSKGQVSVKHRVNALPSHPVSVHREWVVGVASPTPYMCILYLAAVYRVRE